MKIPKSWKLSAPCRCGSGENYRQCCLEKELAFFLLFVITGAVLFSVHAFVLAIVAVALLASLAAWLVDRHFKAAAKSEDRK